MEKQIEHFDVIIVGAGLSGIGAAHHILKKCPGKSFVILEGRGAIGGTWDLFRYPGIRSDSDMYTLGYSFKPWEAAEAIADGPAILSYIKETARDDGVDDKIQFHHKVKHALWSSEQNQWTLTIENSDDHSTSSLSCNFLFMCSGYYNYEEGYTPEFEGIDAYGGQIVHPQKWPEELVYSGKKVVVIGSGATAVTLVPELAKKASEVIMLQRSPTYILSAPQKDMIANFLKKWLPSKVAYILARWKNIIFTIIFFKLCQVWPRGIKNWLMKGVRKELGEDYDVEKHFGPRYDPWDERLCLVPDSDLFKSINEGKSKVITDHIVKFDKEGIVLESGKKLTADIIVTATGLNLQFMGGMTLEVDGEPMLSQDLYCYRGMMYSNIPNLAQAFGYTNASWTLKCDLTCEYVCRILNYMDSHGLKKVTPRVIEKLEETPFLDLKSNYIKRSEDILPKQGAKRPWRLYQNYFLDIFNFRFSSLKDKYLEYR